MDAGRRLWCWSWQLFQVDVGAGWMLSFASPLTISIGPIWPPGGRELSESGDPRRSRLAINSAPDSDGVLAPVLSEACGPLQPYSFPEGRRSPSRDM